MVTVLDSRSSHSGSSPGGDIGLWSFSKTQVDSQSASLTSKYNAGGTSSLFIRLVSHPGESEDIPRHFMLQKPG